MEVAFEGDVEGFFLTEVGGGPTVNRHAPLVETSLVEELVRLPLPVMSPLKVGEPCRCECVAEAPAAAAAARPAPAGSDEEAAGTKPGAGGASIGVTGWGGGGGAGGEACALVGASGGGVDSMLA